MGWKTELENVGRGRALIVISYKSRCILVTLVERETKYLLMKNLENKIMKNVSNAIINTLKILVKTITFDSGIEFADHEKKRAKEI